MFSKIIKFCFEIIGLRLTRKNVFIDPQHKLPISVSDFFDLYFSVVDKKDFFLVQIGANDGSSRDLLHKYIIKYDLPCMLVEPQKDVFSKLVAAYKNSKNVKFANVAVSSSSDELTFYSVKPELISDGNYFDTTAIASLDKPTIEMTIKKRIGKVIKKISDDIDDYIVSSTIKCMTFDNLIKEYDLPKPAFIFLDCEGHDYEILKSIDFNKYNPQIINFESKFLSDGDRFECENMLISNGYQIFRHGNDTCAFK